MNRARVARHLRQHGSVAGVVILVLILSLGGFVGWKAWAKYAARAEQTRVATAAVASLKQMQDLGQQWDDQMKLAASTPRLALTNAVDKLQATRRQLKGIDAPVCLNRSKGLMTQGMDLGIEIFINFMADTKTSDENNAARAIRINELFAESVAAVNDCPKLPQ